MAHSFRAGVHIQFLQIAIFMKKTVPPAGSVLFLCTRFCTVVNERPGLSRTLTELLQTVQVDDVLRGAVISGTDEEVGLLQDEVGLLPLLRVQHGSVPQQTDPLKLPSQQAVTAEGGRSLVGTVSKEQKGKVITLPAGQEVKALQSQPTYDITSSHN